MKIIITYFLLPGLLWNCKQNTESKKPESDSPLQEEKVAQPISPVLAEIANFADVALSTTAEVDQLMEFREIDANGDIANIDLERALDLYKKMKTRTQPVALPIFEIKNTDKVILPIQSIGFGGAIWAKVLVDRAALNIEKIEIEHRAESEGYGAGITQRSFEDQFKGKPIHLDKNTVNLQRKIENRIDDGTMIDGISGASTTNEAVEEMINYGLRKYKGYLAENH